MPSSEKSRADGALNPEFEVGDTNASCLPRRSSSDWMSDSGRTMISISYPYTPAASVIDRLNGIPTKDDSLQHEPAVANRAGPHCTGYNVGCVRDHAVRTSVEAGNVQAPRAHRLDLSSIRADREVLVGAAR